MLEKIIIDNYKSIKRAEIELRNVNILIGSNGSGKSNFISFFELVNAILNQNLSGYVLKRGGFERFLYNGRKESENVVGLLDFDNTNALYFDLRPTIDNNVFLKEVVDFYNLKQDKGKSYSEKWNKKIWNQNVSESDIISNPEYRARYIRNYLKSFTVYHFHDTSITSSMRSGCNISDNETLRNDGSNLAAYLYRLQQKENRHFIVIESIIRSVAPYFKQFKLREDPINKGTIKLEWEQVGSDAYFDAYSFSDGTLRFVALATLLLQPMENATIIIDEPELGLHPFAINKLAAMIKRAALHNQVIVATQSVSLINAFSPEDIIVTDRNGSTSYRRLVTDDLKEWIDDYNMGDIWEKNIIGGQP